MEVTPAEFARTAGVTRQSIYSKIKNRTLIVNTAGLLDTDNALNSRYIADQRRKASRLAPAQPPPGIGEAPAINTASPPQILPEPPPLLKTDADIAAEAGVPQKLLDLPLRDLIIGYGGLYGLERQAKILQQITSANDRYQRTQERGLKLIPKDFVQGTTIQFLKNLARQILEYPEGAVDELIAKVQAHGADAKPEIIQVLRNGLGRIIAGAKEEIIRDLENQKGKYSDTQAEDGPEINEA